MCGVTSLIKGVAPPLLLEWVALAAVCRTTVASSKIKGSADMHDIMYGIMHTYKADIHIEFQGQGRSIISMISHDRL